MSKILKYSVNMPRVGGNPILKVYGMLEIGEVPRLAFVMKLTPKEFTNNPTRKNK
jgi:hypothetical protein